jgi:integrase
MVSTLGLLTDAAIRSWVSKGGSKALHDGSGLYLRRRANGAFWALRQNNAATGKRTWASLFPNLPYPKASLAAARKAASEAKLVEHAQQQDIATLRKAKRAEVRERHIALAARISVRRLFDEWRTIELTPQTRADGSRMGRKDGGQSAFEAFQRRVFPAIGEMAAADVSARDLMAIFDACKASGARRTANVLYANLKQMFRFAMTREIVARNPLDNVRKTEVGGKDVERNRVLSDEELLALFRQLPAAGMEPQKAAAVLIMVATACRISELISAEWQHVDFTGGTWYIPVTKNQRDHTVHLSDFALGQFMLIKEANLADASRHEKNTQGTGRGNVNSVSKVQRWVFPNAKGTGPVCTKTLGKQIADRQRTPDRRLANRSKKCSALILPGGRWTAHDLRRTAATLMARLDISTDVIDECLNHKLQSRVARVYIHDRREKAQQVAFDALGTHLDAIRMRIAGGDDAAR